MAQLLTIAYRIPPLLVAIVLALALLAVASSRGWRWPMVFESALIVVFAARPSVQLLTLGLFLTALRWVSPFAAIVAQTLGVPTWGGLSLPVALFALPGLHAYVRGAERGARAATTGKTTRLESAQPLLALNGLLAYVNARPDHVPHAAIIGPSGSGKTTLATVVLSERPGQIVVLTAKEGDAWGGLPYIGIDDDATYATAEQTFAALDQEVKQRLLNVKQRSDPGEWLTIVLDDFSTLQSECPGAAAVVKLVARLGRALRVRLIMLSDSALVKAIGLEGEGETRANFAFVRLERGHSATLEIDGVPMAVNVRGVDQLATVVQLAARAWVCVPKSGLNQPTNTPHAKKRRKRDRSPHCALYEVARGWDEA